MKTLQKSAEPGPKARIVLYKYLFMTVGLALLGLGISLVVEAELGLASWSVLHKAIEDLSPLTFGQASQAVGGLVIIAGWLLGRSPRLATFLNILFVGWFIDLFRIYIVSTPASLLFRVVFLFGGIGLLGLGVGMYLSAGVGAGPRDNLMLALAGLSSWELGRLRSTMELSVMALGWMLGGPVGVGTIVGSVLMGPAMKQGLRLFGRLETHPRLSSIVEVPQESRTSHPPSSSSVQVTADN